MAEVKSSVIGVEFWPGHTGRLNEKSVPQFTQCATDAEAIALEAAFHKVGWAARAIATTAQISKSYLTSSVAPVKHG